MYHYPEPIPANLPKVAAPMLGTWCMVRAKINKVHNDGELCTSWQREPIDEVKMMFIGVRQVRCGNMIAIDCLNDDGERVLDKYVFSAKHFVTAWLFVETAHKKPVHVLPMDCEILPF